MNVESILNWLGSSAAPGWIAALIMLISLVIQWLRGRQRPSRVIVEQVLDTTLLSAPKDLRDMERVTILYGEQPIDMLWMTELRVKNVGNTVIPEPDIYVRVDSETKMLGVQLEGVPPSSELEGTCSVLKDNTVIVAYPYLNPFHEHKQEMTIKVLCDKKPETLTVEGGGKGWSIAFLSSTLKEHLERTVKRVYFWGGIILIASTLGGPVLCHFLGHDDLGKQWFYISMILFILVSYLSRPVLKWFALRSFR